MWLGRPTSCANSRPSAVPSPGRISDRCHVNQSEPLATVRRTFEPRRYFRPVARPSGPPRAPTLNRDFPVLGTSAELAGSFARACLCKGVLELSGLFRGLCLCPRDSVSRKQRFQFEETRFECAAIGFVR